MTNGLDWLILERSDIAGKDFRERGVYESVLKYQAVFSCIGRETKLWVRNGNYASQEFGAIKIISVTHFPELENGKTYTLVKYEVIKLRNDVGREISSKKVRRD